MKPRRPPQKPASPKAILVHPALHERIAHLAIDEGTSRQELLHRILCHELNRPDLLATDSAASAQLA